MGETPQGIGILGDRYVLLVVTVFLCSSTNGPERRLAEETLSSGAAMSRHIVAVFSITWEMPDIPGQNTPKRQRDENVGD